MASPVRPYLGESAAERVAARRRKLLDVGFELMASDGLAGVSIDLLCKQAGLNKRYFYESFASLDALVGAVVDELASEVTSRTIGAATEAAVRSLDANALARHTLSALVGYLLEDPRRPRVLFRELSHSPAAEAHRRATIRRITQVVSVYGHEHHKARESHPIAEVASAMLVGGTVEVILAAVDGSLVRTQEQLVEDLASLWIALGDGAAAVGAARARARRT